MKIKKIKKVDNLGIFLNFIRDSTNLNDFKNHNLFYGRNGSGKTTLTKLFSCLDNGGLGSFSDLKYEVELEDGSVIKTGDKFTTKVRVFNQEYVEKNIDMIGTKAKPILILGEENQELINQMKKDDETLSKIKDDIKTYAQECENIEKQKGNKFTDVAKVIGANIAGSSTRNYRKPDAEKDFASLSSKTLLNENQIQSYQTTLKQEEKDQIKNINFEIDLDNEYNTAENILKKTVDSIIIERLKNNLDISSWVEQGLYIHQNHSTTNCEFCGQNLPSSRLQDLLNHFNDADKKLKLEIDLQIIYLTKTIQELKDITLPNKAELYTELQTEYTSRLTTFNTEKDKLLLELSTLIKELENKKGKTTESIVLKKGVSNNFSGSLSYLNETIGKHNTKTNSFQTEKDKANQALKNHYLSEIFDEVEQLNKEIIVIGKKIITLSESRDELQEAIRVSKSVISSEHKACGILTQKLATFLGRDELVFEVAPTGGYTITRNGNLAKNLSEGEKTAIAFVYFTIHLEDQDFDKSNGIVVIDDPISSLDSNSLFQAFSFLKNSVDGCEQVFIFTHNFEFLRLLLNRLKRGSASKENFMINNTFNGTNRIAEIRKLDPLLCNHESEYHYLCKILFNFETDGTIASVYHIPNIARKVLDTFLMFRVPNSDTMFKKMEQIPFDNTKKTAIYKFVNDQSHITGKGFDPSLVGETQKNVEYLLEMIEQVSPDHFNILKSVCMT